MARKCNGVALPRLRADQSVLASRIVKEKDCEKQSLFGPAIGENVWIAQNLSPAKASRYHCFTTHDVVQYEGLCDDFGPVNMASVIRYIGLLDEELAAFPSSRIVHCVDEGRRPMTNAVFLLGAYMIIKQNATVDDVLKCFDWLDKSYMEPYRDATFQPSDFDLNLADCWSGLRRGRTLGWIRTPVNNDEDWGQIDLNEYCHYDDPLNGDLHIVVPHKFVAFKGPKDLGKREFADDKRGFRYFSPSYYTDIFDALGVKTVVRLNEPEYAAEDFLDKGIDHHDLEFEDCTSPPQEVVAAFFKLVDSREGLVAVHCKAGLGRTGTLIALYMMRTYGFGAREAIAWLRIMRPGSVIGEQQHYLCTVEDNIRAAMKSGGERPPRAQPSATFSYGSGRSRALAEEVAAGMERRNVLRSGGSFRAARAPT